MRIKLKILYILIHNWFVLVGLQFKNLGKIKKFSMELGKATYIAEYAKIDGIAVKDIIIGNYPSLIEIDQFMKEELEEYPFKDAI